MSLSLRRLARPLTVIACALALVVATIQPPAQAGMVETDSVIAEQGAAADRDRIQALLDRADVQAELTALGVDPAAAKDRVAGLSDAEIAALAGQLGDEPAGEGAVAAAVTAVVVVAAVLFFTDLFGLTDVYPFIRPRS